MSILEQLSQRQRGLSEGLNETNEAGEGIASEQEAARSILEGIHVPEESDMQAIRSAAQANLSEAQQAFRSEVDARIESLSGEGEALRGEASDMQRQTDEGISQIEGARNASRFGASAMETARGGMERTSEGMGRLIDESEAEFNRQRERARANFDRMH